jgi:choline dehydrogenase-like flavoprotein
MVERSAPPCDVLIIGAGAAGSLLAARLAVAGKTVLVAEAGPGWQAADLISSQIWSRRLRWGGPFVASGGQNPIGFGFNAGWGLGGAALHHYGTWPRLHAEDFRMHSLYGRGVDWPLSYDQLAPYYHKIEVEVGVSGDVGAETWRSDRTPYPMPPLTRTRQADALQRGFDALGLAVAPAPMAINSEPYQGRPACLYDGWCDAGCPIMALANPLALYQPLARQHGARFVADAPVIRLLLDRHDRVGGAVIHQHGADVIQPARLVILAAGVVQNPAILLQSTSSAHANGVGNRFDQVGRAVMSHYGVGILGLMPDETDPHLGVTGAQLLCHAGYGKDSHAPPAFGSFQWLAAPSIKPSDVAGIAASRFELTGQALDDFVRQAVRHIANMVGMAEQLPNRDNRVTLGPGRTSWGTRPALLTNRFSASEQALWELMRAQGLAIFRAAGAGQSWSGAPITAHLMGGTPMGSDPHHSVTDSYGRVHDLRNLFIAGTGLFPTSGAANPTFTLHALAARSAEQIINHWGSYT